MRHTLSCLVLIALAGCQTYAPLKLDTQARLAPGLQALNLDGLDGTAPLGAEAVARLALANNPDLAAARRQRGVAQAQMLQAGVLANPVVSGSFSPLLAGPAGGQQHTPAYGLTLTYDIRSLITRRSRRQEAAAQARAVDASLLWQEWQVMAQGRLLAVDIIKGERLLAVLRQTAALLQERAGETQAALARHDATLATSAPDVAAAQAAQSAVLDQARLQLGRRHQLNALLGLAPDASLVLAADAVLPLVDPAQAAADMSSLPDRRPDLAALRYGYAAQDARLRAAILSQFPNVTLGITGSSDNSNVRNLGPTATLELPIFDRGQGPIAVERATRAQLHAEYAQRLAAATGQVGSALTELAVARRQLDGLRAGLAALQAQARVARAARAAGDLDERSALDLMLAPLTRAQEIAALEQTVAEQLVALATWTGAGLPNLIFEGERKQSFFGKKGPKNFCALAASPSRCSHQQKPC